MDIHEVAAQLHENQYRLEGSKELFNKMKELGLVAVFGASDDILVMKGAINNEFYSTVHLNENGVIHNRCEDDCPYHNDEVINAVRVEPRWCEEPEYSWTYQTTIPHATFDILEDDEKYCRGIVFDLKNLKGDI